MTIKERTKPLIEATEGAVAVIAMARAAATVVDDMPAEEYDAMLNDMCAKEFAKYDGKDKHEIMARMLVMVGQSDPEFLLRMLLLGGPDDESDL